MVNSIYGITFTIEALDLVLHEPEKHILWSHQPTQNGCLRSTFPLFHDASRHPASYSNQIHNSLNMDVTPAHEYVPLLEGLVWS